MALTSKKYLKCAICEREFMPTVGGHYIARDPGMTGVAASIGSYEEPKLYDAYDCPYCGSQYIAQGRKYEFKSSKKYEEERGEEKKGDEEEDV